MAEGVVCSKSSLLWAVMKIITEFLTIHFNVAVAFSLD
jgi:hypothetical protein